MEIKHKETILSNALIATPVPLSKPLISDIYTAIQNQKGPEHTPTTIMTYPPDFILQFSNPKSQNAVYASNTLQGDDFFLTLQPWTTSYRCLLVPWETKVTIHIKGIPPQAFHPSTLTPLLASHCDLQTYFDQENGICTVNAFAHNIEGIPEHTYLGLPYENNGERAMHAYPITFETTAYIEYQDTSNSIASSDTAKLFGVDPDVLRETYEKQWKAEDSLNRKNNPSPTDSSDSFDYNNYDPETPDAPYYDSNHEPKMWR